jgi:hypothetical protein
MRIGRGPNVPRFPYGVAHGLHRDRSNLSWGDACATGIIVIQ